MGNWKVTHAHLPTRQEENGEFASTWAALVHSNPVQLPPSETNPESVPLLSTLWTTPLQTLPWHKTYTATMSANLVYFYALLLLGLLLASLFMLTTDYTLWVWP